MDYIYEQIISGQLKPGQRITEESLARDFGVSRTPIREAVRRLVEMGVVVAYPRARLEVATADDEDIRQVQELREDLECLALERAMNHLDEPALAELDTLADHCQRLAQRGSKLDTFRADSEFHLAIGRLSGNRHLVEALARLDVKVQLCRAFSCVSMAKIRRSVAYHRQILTAMRQRDTKAAREMLRRHIRGTRDETIS